MNATGVVKSWGKSGSVLSHQSEIQARITAQLNPLSRILVLPSKGAVESLRGYLNHYCQQAMLELSTLSESGDLSLVALADMIEDEWIDQLGLASFESRLQRSETGINHLEDLSGIWFVMRCLEEANDFYLQNHDKPLTSFDFATANAIGEILLDERICARIETSVVSLTSCWDAQRKQLASYSALKHCAERLIHIRQQWPCFAAHHGIESSLLA
jgi:hypothetical protein